MFKYKMHENDYFTQNNCRYKCYKDYHGPGKVYSWAKLKKCYDTKCDFSKKGRKDEEEEKD